MYKIQNDKYVEGYNQIVNRALSTPGNHIGNYGNGTGKEFGYKIKSFNPQNNSSYSLFK